MAMLGNFLKQPIEVVDYDIDYGDWLTDGDNVESATVTVTPADQLAVDSVFINDPRIKIWVSAGTTGTTYKLEVTTTTADGRVKQDEFRVRVKDI
ncbi:MAG: hypothetical protein V4631_20865 [Pseudomonadota bacterium]